jgi:hypothetical protein
MDDSVDLGSTWKRKSNGELYRVVELKPGGEVGIFNKEKSLFMDTTQKRLKENFVKVSDRGMC